MTPTPPSASSSSAGQSPDARFRVVRKRNRVPLSCGPCRHRKLKCNRGHPCDNCTKRGDIASCAYATPGSRKKSTSSNTNTSPDDMQNRIDRLEGLVLSLMTNGSQSAGPVAAAAAIAENSFGSEPGSSSLSIDVDAPESMKEEGENDESDVEQVAKSIGVMKMDNNRTIFASEAHWYAILGEIAEVKNYYNENKKQYDDHLKRVQASQGTEARPGMTYLLGSTKPATHAEILASFPPKQSADLLITRYFNTYDPSLHIVHGPTYQKQYDRHWQTPSETPVIWLGMSFAMMCIALQSYHRAGDEPPEYFGTSWQLSSDYRRLTAQCLILADITQPIAHMLETLILHVYGDYARSRDAESGILTSVTIITRLAMRMGYHRDPGAYPNISAYEAEMRRRLWSAVRMSDLLFSAQAGLPPIVRTRDSNTELPRNIYDDELYEGIVTLPPSRPATEITPVSYLIAKSRALFLFGTVIEEVHSLAHSQYEDIMKLDQRIREMQTTIAPHLRMRSIEESARDTSSLIMQRFSLDLLNLKSITLLHRKYQGPSRHNPRFAYSRRACIDAAMTILKHQAALHDACRPGGRLRSTKWFISSLNTHDFFLAAMIVALDLYHTVEAERSGRTTSNEVYMFSNDRRSEMLSAIERSAQIWDGLKDGSMEAFKANATLTAMINTLKARSNIRSNSSFAPTNGAFAGTTGLDDPNIAPEHSAAMTLGMLSTGALTPNSAALFDAKAAYPTPNMANDLPMPQQPQTGDLAPGNFATEGAMRAASPFSSLFGSSLAFQGMEAPTNDVNWDAWDNYIQGASMDINNMWPIEGTGMPTPIPDDGMGGQQIHQQAQNHANNLFAQGNNVSLYPEMQEPGHTGL
ncbi:hypothetical protein EJ05DRAFT_502124 [Pseudovirgaria hyperparasitica]|uniref:Zn(2)-C6 fungal-type domain-containing protein n=1 Tax=Pseudovirgaria hyperparasitica TaxID=470096 RepID=A0A6A6W131_9PEZI|nr:uncharacterized protein EJ05DRAFT_502124 [Pseudovirgaria hyperparasitica]KAF2756628.1 hypothetical protein EJ05DRAFT_502124 [Pseudovirgaria hyperparasitica]